MDWDINCILNSSKIRRYIKGKFLAFKKCSPKLVSEVIIKGTQLKMKIGICPRWYFVDLQMSLLQVGRKQMFQR